MLISSTVSVRYAVRRKLEVVDFLVPIHGLPHVFVEIDSSEGTLSLVAALFSAAVAD